MIDSIAESAGGPPDLKRTRRRKLATTDARVDRLPPHSPEAEQGVLGCVLLSPNDCMGECIEKFKSGAEVFYDLRHQTIFGALAEMYDSREAIDVITLQQRLKNKQLLEEVRQNIANLGIFIMKHSLALQASPVPQKLDVLININRQLAAGLRAVAPQ